MRGSLMDAVHEKAAATRSEGPVSEATLFYPTGSSCGKMPARVAHPCRGQCT